MPPTLAAIQGRAGAPAPDALHVDAAVRMVLDAARGGAGSPDFVVRRARLEVGRLPAGAGRSLMARVLDVTTDPAGSGADRACALLEWAGHLEGRRRLPDAAAALELARDTRPDDAELALHAARVARKSGDLPRARELYDRVRAVDGGSGHLSRMAGVGHALLADDPAAALGGVLRAALAAGDREAAAVAQEERARARAAAGDVGGALRDFALAGVRFRDPVDRGRIGHEAADLLVAAGDPLAARRALLEAEAVCHPDQAAHAHTRLRAISRALGDELGRRRWADAAPGRLVSLCPPRRDAGSGPGWTPRLDRWIARLRRCGSADA